jgi:hypothetical protein
MSLEQPVIVHPRCVLVNRCLTSEVPQPKRVMRVDQLMSHFNRLRVLLLFHRKNTPPAAKTLHDGVSVFTINSWHPFHWQEPRL